MHLSKKELYRRALTVLLLTSTMPLSGAVVVWQGSAVNNNDMVSTSDWVGGNLPTNGDTASFGAVAAARRFPNLGVSGTLFDVGSTGILSFAANNNPYNFSISGGSSLICGSITNTSTDTEIFNLNSGSIEMFNAGSTGLVTYNVSQDAYISFFNTATTDSNAEFNLSDNGTLNFNQLGATFSGAVSGSGVINVDQVGASVLTWATPGSLFGSINVIHGQLTDNAAGVLPTDADYNIGPNGSLTTNHNESIGSLAGSGRVNISPGVTLQLSNNKDTTFSGILQNGGIFSVIDKQGTGVFTLSGTGNTYIGTFQVDAGTLQAGAVNAFSPGFTVNLPVAGAVLDLNNYNNTITDLSGVPGTTIALGEGTLTLSSPNNSNFYGNIYGSGGLTIAGGTQFTIHGTTNYTGLTTINAGTLSIAANNTLGPLSGTGGALNINSNTVAVNNYRDTTFAGSIQGAGTFVKQGEGILTLSGTTPGSFTGITQIQDGTIQAGNTTALYSNSAYQLGPNGTLDLNNNSNIIGSLAGDGGLVTLGSGTLTAGTAGTTFSGSITGTGGLILAGSSSLTLSGINSYSGTTQLQGTTSLISKAKNSFSPNSDVTLGSNTSLVLGQYDNTIGSLTGSGKVDMTGGGTLTLADSNSPAAFTGQLTGTGGLIKQGTGTFTLSGTSNNYSGPTQVQGGTLASGATNSFSSSSPMVISPFATLLLNSNSNKIGPLSGAGTVSLGTGTLTTNMTEATTFAGNITGTTGGLTLTGTSALTLSGTNSYTGLTDLTFPGATLAAGATNSFAPASTVSMSTGSNLYLNNFDNTIGALSGTGGNVVLGTGVLTTGGNNASTTFGGVISGRGGIVKEGSGNFTITGPNTYTGTTVIADGTLTSVDGSLPTCSCVVDDSHLVFDQTAGMSITQNNRITGTGDVRVTGPGTLTLLGHNSYTGGTTVDFGSTLIGNSNSLQGNIVDNGAVVFNQTFCGTFTGTFTGAGTITKTGCGTLTMCTTSPAFAGNTFVNQGILDIFGSLGGNLTALSGGTIGGNFNLGGNLVINGGATVTGHINVGGNFTQNAGSTYLVDVDFLGNSSFIHAAGTATLNGGTVQVAANCCFNIDQKYLILEADKGIIGKYDTSVAPFNTPVPYKAILFYTPTEVLLEIVPAFLDCIDGRCTFNQRAIAGQFDAINDLPFIPTDIADVLNSLLAIPACEICGVLDQLTGEQYTSNFITAELNSRQFIRRLYDPIRNIVTNEPFFDPCDPCFTMHTECADIWYEVSGGQICNSRRRDLHGFTTSGVQFTLGIQRTSTCGLTTGLAGSIAYDYTRFHHRGSANTYTGFGGLYTLYTGETGYWLGDLAFGYSSQKMDRTIQFSTFDLTAHGRPNLSTLTFYTEAGTDYVMGNLLIQPFVGIEADYLRRSRFHEGNADTFNLHFKEITRGSWFSRFGLHLTNHACGLDLSADLAWQCCLNHREWKNEEFFKDFGSTFNIFGPNIPRSSFDGALTATKELTEHLNVYAEVAGQVWSHLSTYSITLGAEAFW